MSLLLSPMAKNSSAGFYNGVAKTSVRLEAVAKKSLNRTITTGSRRLFTYSFWFKQTELGTKFFLSKGENVSNADISQISMDGSDRLFIKDIVDDSITFHLVTTRLFRDTSAWYNVVIAFDTAQSTAANRIKVYVNGVQETSFATEDYPGQNYDALFTFNQSSSSVLHIGAYSASTDDAGEHWGGYFSDITHIDGAALAPTSFGEAKNGVWIPIDTSGLTFGDEGYLLKFDQVGVGTASTSTIGADVSGNTNHFTSVNIAASDCAMPDSPENNFCILNSLDNLTGAILSKGNLKSASTSNSWKNVRSTFVMPTGSWYVELLSLVGIGNGNIGIGIVPQSNASPGDAILGAASNSWQYLSNGNWYNNNSVGGSAARFSVTGSSRDIVGMSFDGSEVKFYKNNSLIHTIGSIPTNDYAIGISLYDTDEQCILNFGQDSSFAGNKTAQGNTDGNGIGDFFYTPPSGFLALCSANLPEPTIGPNSDTQATDHFDTRLRTGTGSEATVALDFKPDWLWTKTRSNAVNHNIASSSLTYNYSFLQSNNGNAETTSASAYYMTPTSTGYTVGTGDNINQNNYTFVDWLWKANGGTTTTNDASSTSVGTIDSVFQANTTAGFSIVTFAADNTAGRVVAHGLGVVPKMIITKGTAQETGWYTYHFNIGANKWLRLNEANPEATDTGIWGNTHPTSSVFTIGNNVCGYNNGGANEVIAFCFAEIEGYSKFGSFVGNVDADGVMIFTNFSPSFVLVKRTTGGSTYNWFIHDNKRGASNVNKERLTSDTNEAEATGITSMDFLSNGFKIRTANTSYNEGTVIYMAFAEAPFKYANAR